MELSPSFYSWRDADEQREPASAAYPDWPIARSEVRSEKDILALSHDNYSNINLPELAPRQPTPRPVTPATLHHLEVALQPNHSGLPEHVIDEQFPEALSTETREIKEPKRRVCGIRLWILVILVIALNVGVIGGVLGNVLVKKPTRTSDATQDTVTANSSYPTSNPEKPTTPSTPSPTSTIVPINRERFKISSIAACHCEGTELVQVFHMENGTIKAHSQDNGTWSYLGELAPVMKPKASSPIAAASWLDRGDTNTNEIRVYYFNDANQLIELGAQCSIDNSTPVPHSCRWLPAAFIETSVISDKSGLAVAQWGSSTDTSQLRVYYENDDGRMDISIWAQSKWGSSSTPVILMPGSSISVTTEINNGHPNDIAGAIWYRGLDQQVYKRPYNNATINPAELQWVDTNTTSVNPYSIYVAAANFAAWPDRRLWTSFIDNDKRPVVNNLPQRVKADDAGGAIAGVVWRNYDGIVQSRLFYSVNGSVQEMIWDTDAWVTGKSLLPE